MKIPSALNKPLIQKAISGILLLLGLILVFLSLDKEIYLIINGEFQEYQTYALTVGGFLKSQDISLEENDRITPDPSRFLKDGETILLSVSNSITIQADGDEVNLNTAERDPENVILEAGFLLFPKDRLMLDGVPASKNTILRPGVDHVIEILRATEITLREESGEKRFFTDANTLAQALEAEDITLYPADELSFPLETELDGSPLNVELIRSIPVRVQLSDQTITIRTTAETVGAALAGVGLALQGLDYSSPPENEPLPEDSPIQVVRVKEEILLKQEQIPFTSEYQPANDLELDQFQILNGGEYGLSAQRVRIVSENGVEVSRELDKEWVIKEPIPRIVGYGTQINIKTANTPDGQIRYWRKITAYATSYNETCEGCKTYTASGADLRQGVIAVRLSWYRYMKGMKVYIPGYGFASIEDVGGGVPWSNNWVDLGYKEKNYVPWSQNVEVYFLAPPPPPENIMYVLN